MYQQNGSNSVKTILVMMNGSNLSCNCNLQPTCQRSVGGIARLRHQARCTRCRVAHTPACAQTCAISPLRLPQKSGRIMLPARHHAVVVGRNWKSSHENNACHGRHATDARTRSSRQTTSAIISTVLPKKTFSRSSYRCSLAM